jgi:hypothetical protein
MLISLTLLSYSLILFYTNGDKDYVCVCAHTSMQEKAEVKQ